MRKDDDERAPQTPNHPDDEGQDQGSFEEVFEAYFESGEPVELDEDSLEELLKDIDPEDVEVLASEVEEL